MSVPAATKTLFWRRFGRQGVPDTDLVANEEFRTKNFIDFFGTWLQKDSNALSSSFDELITTFRGQTGIHVHIFLISDGSFVRFPDVHTVGPDDSFDPNVRLIAIIFTDSTNPTNPTAFRLKNSTQPISGNAGNDWTLCVVGDSNLTEKSRTVSFLQVASWDGELFRFYQNHVVSSTTQAWTYFGNSWDAFGPNAYLGPFNGHVNGACIMKELRDPWIHWFGGNGNSLFIECLPPHTKAAFQQAPYLSTSDAGGLLGNARQNPGELEKMITTGVSNWFRTRVRKDFFTEESSWATLDVKPRNIPRWAAHLFLTTTINLVGAQATGLQPFGDDQVWLIPDDHFFASEFIKGVDWMSSDDSPSLRAQFRESDYNVAVSTLGLSMLREVGDFQQGDIRLPASVLAEGQTSNHRIFRPVLLNSEGQVPFNILQMSFEDAQGIRNMQSLRSKIGLFPANVLNAVLMVDFWNPIYSWRRGILMTYIPNEATLDVEKKAFDIGEEFVKRVRESPWAKIPGSPEQAFLELLDKAETQHQASVQVYFTGVESRLNSKTAEVRVAAVTDYLKLAESRRRIYRPLPLDEFGLTLPYALNLPITAPHFEMRADGTIGEMDARGVKFLNDWTHSLASRDPIILPNPAARSLTTARVLATELPKAANLAIPCQRSTLDQSSGGCPVLNSRLPRSSQQVPVQAVMTITELSETVPATHPPTWNDDILPLITAPPWLPEDRRKSVGSGWVNAMRFYSQWNLDNYDDVRGKATQIYTHLRSKAMPITRDPKEFWPEKALETFRDWANAGFPKDSSSDTVAPYVIIPPPKEPEVKVRERPDIMSLSKEQLATYQAKLDDVLNVGSLRSKWQELGLIHAEWCLHYQEATFLWHRAHLRYVEELIDLPIPYWNGFATATSDPSSKFSGLPPAFLEETYVHPLSGKIRPNPLKYALAIDGVGVEANGEKTKYVTRDPILVGGPSSEGWADKVKLFAKYHQQMRDALKCEVYTTTADAQGLGKPWANILKFTEDQPDDLYPFRMHFDGCFEQVHDNIHGWVGYDMADNSRTAFDPIFLSYHANMDRLASYYMESHPETQFTSSYPLQPFVKNATDVSYTDPRRWIYTTIGDMAKDVRALGYTYLMPASPDVWVPPLWTETHGGRLQVNGGQAISLATQQDMVNSKPNLAAASVASGKPLAAEEQVPYIVFRDVGCTTASYSVDILVAGSREKDAEVLGAGHIGQIARIGMGKGRPVIGFSNTRRVCKAPNSTRVVSAEKFAGQLRQKPNVELIVREMTSGKVLTEEEYTKLPGFKPEVIWLPSRLR